MNSSESKLNRRAFLQKSAAVAAGSAAINSAALSYTRIIGANDRISLGHIGVGNRGT
ncbi:MAG: gfo/Idh/MocA family oxidoreductase, partial [Acidobacteria bacterium]